ncbi:MAG: APC family permease [Bryobacteraceae bacterium]
MTSDVSNRPEASAASPPAASLKRIFGLGHLVLFGITFVCPTAPFPMFGIVSSVSRGHMAAAYMIAMVVMLLTAFSYGRMASAFPAAGSAYTYAGKAIHPMVGFFAGWAVLLDYMLMPLMSVIYLSLTAGRVLPQVPEGIWLVVFAVGITVINLFGLKVTNRANFIMTAIMVFVVGFFVVAAAAALRSGTGAATLWSLKPFCDPAHFSWTAVMSATSIAAFSFLGFDGISTLAEDSRNPARDIGRATVLVCFVCGALFILQAYLGQLIWPDYTSYPKTDTAFLDVSRLAGGEQLFFLVSFVLVVAGLASAVTGQASASRILLGMGRDRILPRRIFAYIHPKYSTPTYGILAMGVVSLLGGFFFSFRLAAEAINFGALLGFMGVNLSVIRHYYIRGNRRSRRDLMPYLVMPLGGFLSCLYVFINLSNTAKWIGVIWCTLGLLHAAWHTKGFRRALPSVSLVAPED